LIRSAGDESLLGDQEGRGGQEKEGRSFKSLLFFLVSSSLLASLPKIVASKQNSVVKFQSF
jgi:hypothetical protein